MKCNIYNWYHIALASIFVLHLFPGVVSGAEDVVLFNPSPEPVSSHRPLSVLTLNIAHGRGTKLNQIFLSESAIRNNIGDVAELLKRENVDVVALQEADAPSWWSGSFDHVKLLSVEASYPEVAHSIQASSPVFSYGTALLSKLPFNDILHHTFEPSPPTLSKGFTLGQIEWMPLSDSASSLIVDIVSVHLDFSRKSIREQQISELIDVLSGRKHPTIIIGDFNSDWLSDWLSDDTVVRRLADEFRLRVYRPEAKNLATYQSKQRRLDWILISDDLDFADYRVLPDVVSDHYAVVASIVVK